MLVRRLELQGFKSFAERTVLEFGPGVTGIVGPNGAGKSNLADAVRWVLGEQNPRLLRSSRMEDLIFNGSGTRKPLGFAEAILVLDNSDARLPVDYTEVSITRRLYRSGESEYLLNGSPVRLRDVEELLAGTGLGRDGYSFIGQGRIDEILMGAPESRRRMFDEACGIGVHRERRREALARLDDVAARLQRVSDVTAELEAQLAPLDEQAAIARAFVGHRDELERLELWQEAAAVRGLRAKAEAARTQLAKVRQELDTFKGRRAQLEEEAKTLRAAYAELGEFVEQRQQQVALSEAARRELAAKIGELERAVAQSDRESGLTQEELGRLAERRSRLIGRLEEIAAAGAARAERLAAARLDFAEAEQARTAAAEELRRAREAGEAVKTELLEVANQAGSGRHELETARSEAERLRAEAARLAREAETGREELARLATEIGSLRERAEKAESEAGRCAAALSELERKETACAAGLADVGRKLERQRATIGDLEAEKAALEAAAATESAWSRAALAVAAAARDRVEASGRLVAVLGEEVDAAPVDRLALETALGRYTNALVVRTESDLRHYVSHLKGESLGPAVIVPLDLVAEHLKRRADGRAGREGRGERVRGGASLAQAVSCREELRPVVDYLLGGTLLASGYEEAREAVDSGRAERAVTRDGLLVRPGGVVSVGGSGGGRGEQAAAAGAGSLERMRRLRVVREALATGRDALAALSAERETLERVLAEARSERPRLASRHQELAAEKAAVSGELEAKRQRETVLRLRLEVLGQELPEMGQRALGLEAKAGDLADKVHGLERREEKLRSDLAEREALAGSADEKLAAAGQRVGELRVLIATLEEQERSQAAEAARLREDAQRLEAEETGLTVRLSALAQAKEAAVAELSVLRQSSAAPGGAAAGAGSAEDLDSWRARRQEAAKELEARENELATLRGLGDELLGKEHREELRLSRIEAEEELVVRRLRRDYGDDWENRAKEADPAALGLGEGNVPGRIVELRRAMSSLGVVNIGAIEEHRRLSERADFLKAQAHDLEQARSGLLELVAEMDQTMATKFEEAFLAVRRAFRDRIPALFGGGRGDLILTNRDELLASGIEILVEPPSKRLQSLALLSAGERALSALALLLSFLEVRPSPCAILDEIDAPLDDANVARFSLGVASLAATGRTQFIIITHNKATMEISEALYGATMGDDGVSRLVSVKLEDREELRKRLEKEEG